MDNPSEDYQLLRIQTAADMLRKQEKETERHREHLGRVIKEAHDAGVGIVQIGLAGRLSRVTVYKHLKKAVRG